MQSKGGFANFCNDAEGRSEYKTYSDKEKMKKCNILKIKEKLRIGQILIVWHTLCI